MGFFDYILPSSKSEIMYAFFPFQGQITPEVVPEFLASLENHTVPQGRDVAFTCVVNHLQSYRVSKKC